MTETMASMETGMPAIRVKSELLCLLDALPSPRQAEVLDFARFLHQQTVLTEPPKVSRYPPIQLRVVPATTLLDLTGLVALGGDAVVDTEALYDNASHH
jgi:hypothetical protein